MLLQREIEFYFKVSDTNDGVGRRDHEKITLISQENGLFSHDNGIIYQVSFHHVIEPL